MTSNKQTSKYNIQIANLRTSKSLFLGLSPPHKAVGAKTLARWMTGLMQLAGIDISEFSQHSSRSAAAAYLRDKKSLSVNQICKLADWSTVSGVYKKFYERYICD